MLLSTQKVTFDDLREECEKNLDFPYGKRTLASYVKRYAQDRPDKVAINFYGRKLTFKELDELSDRLAAGLAAMGCRKGDRIAVFMQNCPQAYLVYLAASKLGLIKVPVDPMHREHELKHQITDSGSSLIVTHDQIYPIVRNVRDECGLKNVIVTSFHDFLPSDPELPLHPMMAPAKQTFPDTVELMDLIRQYPPDPPEVEVELGDTGWLLYTGGTTGLPKGCVHTYYNELIAGVGMGIPGFDPSIISAFPVSHISGVLMYSYISVWGGTLVMLARWDPAAILEAVQKYKLNMFVAPAVVYNSLMAYPGIKDYDLSSLRICQCTSHGGPFRKEHAAKWYEATGTYLYSWGYSGTEYFDYPLRGDILFRLEEFAYGKVWPGWRIKIVDENRREVPLGERGEIVAKTASLFKGYWNNPEKTGQVLVNGWFYTGDMGSLGPDGTLYFYGRKSESFKVSGYTVSPDEVAAIGLNNPDIQEIAVIPVPNPQKPEDNIPKAFVTLKPGSKATAADLIRWFENNIAIYKCPREIEIKESLPKSNKGEILKRELKEEERKRRGL